MKSGMQRSLRYQVEKWLAPVIGEARVARFGRTDGEKTPFVCVQTSHNEVSRALFFFRHNDGNWYVYPPAPRSVGMRNEWITA